MSLNYTSFVGGFLNAAYQFIAARERKFNGLDLYPHDVGDGQVTIGAGINMTSGKNTNKFAVYSALGIMVDSQTGRAIIATGTTAQRTTEQGYVTRLNSILASTLSVAQKATELDKVMAARAADSVNNRGHE